MHSATKAYKILACDTLAKSAPVIPSKPSGSAAVLSGFGAFSSSGIGICLARLQVPQGGARKIAMVFGCRIQSKTIRCEFSSVRSSERMLDLAPLHLCLSIWQGRL